MGKFSRDKGKRGEREVIELLQPAVDEAFKHLEREGVATARDSVRLQRNTLQSDKGGFDVSGLPWLALEVKNAATLQIPAWWKQTLEQTPQHGMPLLMWKQAGGKGWRARTIAHVAIHGAANMWCNDCAIDVDVPTLQRLITGAVYHREGMRLWHERQRREHGINGTPVNMRPH